MVDSGLRQSQWFSISSGSEHQPVHLARMDGERIISEAGDPPDATLRSGIEFDEMERLFARFEHYTVLAQLALEDLQMHLSERRERVAEDLDGEQPPANVTSLHAR